MLEKVLKYLDYESIVNLRATCQVVRTAVDDLLANNTRLRFSFSKNRKADLWLRAKPHVSDIKIINKLKDEKVNVAAFYLLTLHLEIQDALNECFYFVSRIFSLSVTSNARLLW
jgi:hypothetical protein